MRKIAGLGALAVLLLSLAAGRASAEEDGESAAGPETAAAEAPARPPITSIGGSPPDETPQQRLERFKREKGAGSDKPFEGFAVEAEKEMQRLRDEAIAGSGVAPGGGATNAGDASLESEILRDDAEAAENRAQARERLADQLAELGPGAWGPTPCFAEHADFGVQDDWIRHRQLTRADFLSDNAEKARLAVRVPNAETGAYVAVTFTCELTPAVTQVREGLWTAEVSRAEFFAMLSRRNSWWNDSLPENAQAYTLGHEQLHFDIAEAFTRWLNRHRGKILAKLRGTGKTESEAIGRLQLDWAKLMLAIEEDFDTIETAYDRDTKHGTVLKEQTFWSWRVRDGFDEIAKTVRLRTRKYVE